MPGGFRSSALENPFSEAPRPTQTGVVLGVFVNDHPLLQLAAWKRRPTGFPVGQNFLVST
jgi:hypothetical protein